MKELLSIKKSPGVQLRGYSLKAELTKTLRVHFPFIALVLFYAAATLIVARIYHVTDKAQLSLYSKYFYFILVSLSVLFFISLAIHVMLFVRPDRPIRYLLNELRTNYLTPERLLNALPVLLLMPMFMSAFTSIKSMIPDINPFSWDFTFAKWDAVVHGGVQPWRLLQPIFGRPLLTSVISFFYNVWFLVKFGVLFWQAFSLRDARLRMQFILTFSLAWILLGTLAAIIFSSAGPCYYGRVVEGEDIFQPLMEYLRDANESYTVFALHGQETLWESYENSEVKQITGISAMPSMHISMAFLFVLVGLGANRVIGIALGVFAVLNMIGCVYLGWHYAIDGYAAIACTWLLWWAVGLLIKRYGAFLGI